MRAVSHMRSILGAAYRAAMPGPATEGGRASPGLLGNIAALGLLQLSSYILPLAIAAYTTRVLGIAEWGRVALVQLVLGFFSLVVAWGFNWSATRKIAAMQDNTAETSRVAIATMLGQALLAGAMALLLLAVTATVPFFVEAASFYHWGLLVLAGTALFPNWFLTGLERLREFSAIQIGGRFLTFLLIVLLVRGPADAPLIIAVQGVVSIAAGLVSLWWLRRAGLLTWQRPRVAEVLTQLREGGAIFLSTTSISIYVNLTPVILGILAGPVAVGQFALADRIRQAAQSVLQPVSTALFPRISRMVAADPHSAGPLLRVSGAGLLLLSAGISAALFLFAGPLVRLIGGAEFAEAAHVLRWLSPLPLAMCFSTFLGLQVMLPNRRTRAFNTILIAAGLLSLALIVPLAQARGAEGAALTLLIVEGFVSLAMVVYVLRTGYFRGRWHGASAPASG